MKITETQLRKLIREQAEGKTDRAEQLFNQLGPDEQKAIESLLGKKEFCQAIAKELATHGEQVGKLPVIRAIALTLIGRSQ
ncbi:MAG: hypothetical protein HOE73_00460 [Bacteroidetes Order II. Incertae sedis bacterium]|jgi:hypothetical protein|nr:hypothetical protein [Bacteroidetes Order II. bacterium]